MDVQQRSRLGVVRKSYVDPPPAAPRHRGPPRPPTVLSLSDLARDPEQLIGTHDVVRLRLAPSYATLMRWLAIEHFPQPIQLGERCLAWRGKTLLAWLDEREAKSRQAPERAGQARMRRQKMRRRHEEQNGPIGV